MTNEQFEALVGKLEEQARNHPASYQRRVLLLSLLGNLYATVAILLVAAALIACIALISVLKLVALKFVVIFGLLFWRLLKALWVQIEPPTGTEISADQAPELFALIEELCRSVQAVRIHHVLVDDAFNAGVVQSPRFGLFGGYHNYLIIGLPLLKSLTVEQFKSVLAHEIGHLAKAHGKVSNWIYRQRLRWARLINVLEQQGGAGAAIFKPFVKWFVPYFNAYSFPMARANEYEADATSVRLTSAAATAEALTSVNVVDSYLGERFWPRIHQQADVLPKPNFAPYSMMAQGVTTELDEASTQIWLKQALARQTTSADTHPALMDRLKAIGESPRIAPPGPGKSADQLLGNALQSLNETFDRRWTQTISTAWRQRYDKVEQDRKELVALNARLESGSELTRPESCRRALLIESVGKDPEAALQQWRVLQEQAPDDAVACFHLGSRLLERNDDTGHALIEHAMRLDSEATAEGCRVLRDYHWRNERRDEAEAWHQRMIDGLHVEQGASAERNRVLTTDQFEPHELTSDQVNRLRQQLTNVTGVRKAYLVRKHLQYLSHKPLYVFGYSVTHLFQLHSKERAAAVLKQIQSIVEFPGETLIICVDGENYKFGRKMRWMRGTRI